MTPTAPQRIHVYPVDRKNRSTHITKKHGQCWCEPEHMNVCSESDAQGECVPGCWRCGGRGLVPVYDPDLPILLVHREGQLTDA